MDRDLKALVRREYGGIASKGSSCCQQGCCGASLPEEISRRIGYSEEEIRDAPAGSNLGLGCGNPIASASLQEGETVLDLGSGAGFDCFLASRAVGPSGRVIGVDMTPEMIERAEENAAMGGYGNVEFRLGDLEDLPLADASVDVVISNCVINLVPDKRKAFQEAFRVLRPGGRLAVSDIVLLRDLPESIRGSPASYIGCISGAVSKEEYLGLIESAGFRDVFVAEETVVTPDLFAGGRGGTGQIGALASSIKVVARRP